MTDSGWQYPGGEPAGSGPYGGAPPPGTPPPPPQQPWGGAPVPSADPAGPPAETWQQPDYGAPPPPGPQQRSWPIMALFGAVVLLVVAIIGVAVTSGGGDDTATNSDDTTDTSGEPDEPDTTDGPDTTDDPDGPQEPSGDPGAFVDEEGGYEITLPDKWRYTSLSDPDSAGAAMFPDDSEKAGIIQQTVGVLPRAISFYGVVGEEVGAASFVTNVNINATPAPGAEDLSYEEFAGQITQGIDMIGATVTGDAPFELAGVEGARVEFDYDAALGASGVQYASVIDGELWVVNFASSDVAGLSAEFDEIASSFRVTG